MSEYYYGFGNDPLNWAQFTIRTFPLHSSITPESQFVNPADDGSVYEAVYVPFLPDLYNPKQLTTLTSEIYENLRNSPEVKCLILISRLTENGREYFGFQIKDHSNLNMALLYISKYQEIKFDPRGVVTIVRSLRSGQEIKEDLEQRLKNILIKNPSEVREIIEIITELIPLTFELDSLLWNKLKSLGINFMRMISFFSNDKTIYGLKSIWYVNNRITNSSTGEVFNDLINIIISEHTKGKNKSDIMDVLIHHLGSLGVFLCDNVQESEEIICLN